jgi:tripartite-type tricarboxylate transporter receptor subunit TctC
MTRLMRTTLALLCAVIGVSAAEPAAAQAWPNKPVRLVVPFAAGGTTDIVARLISQELSKSLGQTFAVDNRPGAAGNIGADMVAKSAPDGYTFLMGTVGTHAINASLYKTMPYDTVKDFTPVTLIASVPNILVVHPSVPANSVQELIAYGKANPGKLNFASSGVGSSIHLSGELFKSMTGVEMTHVAYRGSTPALTDLVGGQVQLMFDNLPSALPHVQGGKLKALAVTGGKRAPVVAELPTVIESGLPGFETGSWFGVIGPAGVPKEIVQKLDAEIQKAMPGLRDRLLQQGAEPIGLGPDRFAAHITAEMAKWGKVVREAGVSAE